MIYMQGSPVFHFLLLALLLPVSLRASSIIDSIWKRRPANKHQGKSPATIPASKYVSQPRVKGVKRLQFREAEGDLYLDQPRRDIRTFDMQ